MKRTPLMIWVLLAACGNSTPPAATKQESTPPGPAVIEAAGKGYRISGPYAHENLAVYLLHSEARDERDFITLDEGLKDGSVTVTEKGEGQVSELLLENSSSRALFIQEGDRVKGGKQDRIVGLSFVVPSKSGKMPIPSFCVEQGRWSELSVGGGGGFSARFGSGDRQLAPKAVRAAAKAGKDQSEVWEKVAEAKAQSSSLLGAENTNTSLNETMDSEKTKKAVEPMQKHLEAILADKSDAVGVAFAVNGKIEELNIYPGHKLLAKLYPRLLGSYALSAVLEKKDTPAPPASEVAAFMRETGETSKRTENVAENTVVVRSYRLKVECVTEYQGKSVHTQWMRRDDKPSNPAGNEQRQQVEQNAPQRR